MLNKNFQFTATAVFTGNSDSRLGSSDVHDVDHNKSNNKFKGFGTQIARSNVSMRVGAGASATNKISK